MLRHYCIQLIVIHSNEDSSLRVTSLYCPSFMSKGSGTQDALINDFHRKTLLGQAKLLIASCYLINALNFSEEQAEAVGI